MKLVTARIKNFRGIKDLTIEFADTTVLLGENSTGKSAVLDALKLALSRRWGSRGTGFVEYDFFMDEENRDPKQSPGVRIELQFSELKVDEWHEDIRNDLEEIVQLNLESGLYSITLVTECKFDDTTRSFETTWTFLALDGTSLGKKSQRATNLSRFFDYAPVFSVSALRDSAQEFSSRSSLWGQLLRRVDVPQEVWTDIEAGLQDLNKRVLSADPRLEGLRSKLSSVGSVLNEDTASAVDIRALPLRIWDLVQRAEVIVRGRSDSPWLPLNRHGHGTQSLSVIYLFQAFAEQLLREEFAAQAEPLLLLEEPEAHLHPQAARGLGKELIALSGQKVVTTHSPYFVERIPIRSIRIMRASKDGCRAYALRRIVTCAVPANEAINALVSNPQYGLFYNNGTRLLEAHVRVDEELYRRLLASYTSAEERRDFHPLLKTFKDESTLLVKDEILDSLQDWARRTRGEIFFARVWLLCEGQAEYILYRAIMEVLDFPLDRNGVALIDYKNNGDEVAFVSLARALGFPWLLTCDGDAGGKAVIERLKRDAGITPEEASNNICQLDCPDLESQLVTKGLRTEVVNIAKVIDSAVTDAVSDADLVSLMARHKIEFASRLAARLLNDPALRKCVPPYYVELKKRLSTGQET